jgi:hypothetical protein
VPIEYFSRGFSSTAALSETPLYSVNEDVVVEAFVGGDGRVYDYTMISFSPQSAAAEKVLRAHVANVLLTAQFEPATSLGRPVSGKVLISFQALAEEVTVRG